MDPTDGVYTPPMTGRRLFNVKTYCRKVAFVLEALGLTYESVFLDFQKGEHKAPSFTQYNPNGRIPAIIDHANNDFVVWSVIFHTAKKIRFLTIQQGVERHNPVPGR